MTDLERWRAAIDREPGAQAMRRLGRTMAAEGAANAAIRHRIAADPALSEPERAGRLATLDLGWLRAVEAFGRSVERLINVTLSSSGLVPRPALEAWADEARGELAQALTDLAKNKGAGVSAKES